jgi:uncharacterized protein (DUF305 family)
MLHFRIAPLALAGIVSVVAGCGRADHAGTDSAAPSADSAAATAEMNRPSAKDAEHDFLRKMSDHHESLVQMAMSAMTKASRSATQGDAHILHTKQAAETKRMVAQIQADYGETFMPMAMPAHKAMADSLAAKSGAEYDRTFYRSVVEHHREALRMIDEAMPRLTKPGVKAMAEAMKADQQKEIVEFERKAGA